MFTSLIADALLPLALGWADFRHRRSFLAAARDPRAAQRATLERLLRANAETVFGREHGFSSVRTADDYRRAVPVQTYESLAALIDRQAMNGEATLTAEQPMFYARTSGTTGRARDFPVTPTAQAQQRVCQRILSATAHRGSGLFSGAVLGFASPFVEGHLPGGQPYGSASGQTHATTPQVLRAKFLIPPESFEIAEAETKYHVYSVLGLRNPAVSGLITANPSTLVTLFDHADRSADAILRAIHDGHIAVIAHLPAALRDAVAARLSPDPARARALGAIYDREACFRASLVWPRLSAVLTWTCGSCGFALNRLRTKLPEHVKAIEIGYRASEFIGTVNVDAENAVCLPALEHTVFEFVEQGAWEAGRQDFLWLHELEQDRRYYVFATTASGLYRYDINDLVEVSCRHGACPALRFVQKGRGVTSITGEKLYEGQVIAAFQKAVRRVALSTGFFVLLAVDQESRYDLFVELPAGADPRDFRTLGAALDAELRAANLEYDAKRASLRLDPPRVVFLMAGVTEAHRCHAVAKGQRESQYKAPCLDYRRNWDFDFTPHILRSGAT